MSGLWIVLFVALWLVVVGETVLVLGLSRRLTAVETPHLRQHSPQQRGTMGALPPGTPLPREAAEQLALTETGTKASVLLFLGVACDPCTRLADDFRAAARGQGEEDDFEIIVVTSDAGAERFSHVGRIVVDTSGTIARRLSVPGTPFGFGIDPSGIIGSVGLPNVANDVRVLGQQAALLRSSGAATS